MRLLLSSGANRVKTTRGRRLSRSLNPAVLDVYLKKFKVTLVVHGLAPPIVPRANPVVELRMGTSRTGKEGSAGSSEMSCIGLAASTFGLSSALKNKLARIIHIHICIELSRGTFERYQIIV